MVNSKRKFNRSAFSMIELIFAIVLIAISVISLPMMTQTTAKGMEGNLVQEAIFAASAELNQAVSYYWDENSTQNSDTLSRVVWTSSTDCNTSTKLRQGHILQTLHRRCLDDNSSRPTLEANFGLEFGESSADDLDDTNNSTHEIFVNYNASSDSYKEAYKSTINVSYADFGTITQASQNIKKVEVSITDSNNKTITSLKTYSANIGEIDYYKRSY